MRPQIPSARRISSFTQPAAGTRPFRRASGRSFFDRQIDRPRAEGGDQRSGVRVVEHPPVACGEVAKRQEMNSFRGLAFGGQRQVNGEFDRTAHASARVKASSRRTHTPEESTSSTTPAGERVVLPSVFATVRSSTIKQIYR